MGLADQPGLRVNGQELSENSILLIWPGADTWTFIPESCAYYVAHFEASDFLTCLEHLYPSIKSMITTSGIGLYHCLPDYVESLRNLLVDGLYGQMGCAAAIKELYSDLRFNVLDMLAATYSTQNTNRGAADSRRKVALKTCKYIEANFQRTITLEELTRGVNCSHRTLQRIFRETFDLTILTSNNKQN